MNPISIMPHVKTTRKLEYTVEGFIAEENIWEVLRTYPESSLAHATADMVSLPEKDEDVSQARIIIYEVIEEDTLRDIHFGTKPVLSRKQIATINN